MPEVMKLPYMFVDYLTKPGLSTTAGAIPLNQYMCKTISNGGNDNTHNLLKNLRWFKDGGNGTQLNTIVGSNRMDILLKGQGHPDDFVKVWNFMCKNKDQLDKYKLKVGHRPKSNRDEFKVDRTGTVYELYFKGNSDATALKMMVQDRFFGIDCIGFVANYLIHVGVWDKYYGYEIPKWDKVFKENVKKAADVERLNLLLWSNHVAIIDWVWGQVDDTTVQVDVCQSSSGGPQCNEFVYLRETNSKTSEGYKLFKIIGGGTPKMPVDKPMSIMKMKDLFY